LEKAWLDFAAIVDHDVHMSAPRPPRVRVRAQCPPEVQSARGQMPMDTPRGGFRGGGSPLPGREGERPISKLEVLRNNHVIYVRGSARKVSLKFEDEGLGSFQDDGSRAWSSPVWVICPSYPDLSLRLVSSKDLLERRLRGRAEHLLGGRTSRARLLGRFARSGGFSAGLGSYGKHRATVWVTDFKFFEGQAGGGRYVCIPRRRGA